MVIIGIASPYFEITPYSQYARMKSKKEKIMIKLFPSLISSNLLCIEKSITLLEPYCDGFHLDVMDNHFVPNLTFGADMVHAIARATQKQLWVHLMVDNPMQWCQDLQLPEGSMLSFHFESTDEVEKVAECITEKKWIASITISPKTSAEKIFPFLDTINHVLVMSVEPGFSGQRFLPDALEKVTAIREYKPDVIIGMDGGINLENIASIAAAGAQDLAIASAIFESDDPVAAIKELRNKA